MHPLYRFRQERAHLRLRLLFHLAKYRSLGYSPSIYIPTLQTIRQSTVHPQTPKG